MYYLFWERVLNVSKYVPLIRVWCETVHFKVRPCLTSPPNALDRRYRRRRPPGPEKWYIGRYRRWWEKLSSECENVFIAGPVSKPINNDTRPHVISSLWRLRLLLTITTTTTTAAANVMVIYYYYYYYGWWRRAYGASMKT